MVTTSRWFDENRVFVFVAWGTATKQSEFFGTVIGNLVFGSRWNGNGITGSDFLLFPVNHHGPDTAEDEVDFFAAGVIMRFGGEPRSHPRFGERLIADTLITMSQELADFRAVFGDERLCFI
jgi:hypothetical protein